MAKLKRQSGEKYKCNVFVHYFLQTNLDETLPRIISFLKDVTYIGYLQHRFLFRPLDQTPSTTSIGVRVLAARRLAPLLQTFSFRQTANHKAQLRACSFALQRLQTLARRSVHFYLAKV